jgi:hypothetical protein
VRTIAGWPPDLDSISDFQRLLAAEVSGRDHLVAAAELVATTLVVGLGARSRLTSKRLRWLGAGSTVLVRQSPAAHRIDQIEKAFPPFARMLWPVIHPASSLATETTAPAMSPGSAIR